MKKHIEFHTYHDRESLIAELVTQITSRLTAAIARNGQASLAVSGGSTPVPLFARLSTIDIPWQDIAVTLVDERWVATSDTDSNEHLVRTHLLQNRAAAAVFTGMKNPAKTASNGEAECTRDINKIHRPFDVLILGLGNDGHTASLFPGAEKLPQATEMNSGKICIGITPVTAPHERMTLTLPAILDSKKIFLHITGEAKKEVLEQALTEGAAEEMPIRFVLRQQAGKQKTPISIYWAQ